MRTAFLLIALAAPSIAAASEITAGDPIVLGPREAAAIDAVVRSALPALTDCGETRGRLVAKFTVAPTGAVTAASIRASTLTVPQVERCVLSVVLKLSFPKQRGADTVVSYPLQFGEPVDPPSAGAVSRLGTSLGIGLRADPIDAAIDEQRIAIGACLAELRPPVVGSAVVRFGFNHEGLAQQIVIIDGTADAAAAAPCLATHLGTLQIAPGAGLRAAYVALDIAP